jgi:hypothetical protein
LHIIQSFANQLRDQKSEVLIFAAIYYCSEVAFALTLIGDQSEDVNLKIWNR